MQNDDLIATSLLEAGWVLVSRAAIVTDLET